MTLLPWEITSVRVTGLSRDKFTMGNIHGYVKNSKETAYNIKLGKKQGFFDTQGKTANQNSSTWNPPKLLFLNGFLSHCWEKDRWWHGRFHVKMKEAKFWTGLLG